MENKRLIKDKPNGMVFGVCSGLGNYFGVDPIFFRLAFICTTLFVGGGIIAYIIAALVMPTK